MWVVTASCITCIQEIPETHFPYSGLCLQPGDIEEFTIESFPEIDAFGCYSENMLEHHSEENPKECGTGSEDASLFHTVVNVECLMLSRRTQ